jgi:eukaryotic-like serine/threonine-protein kinase
MAKLLSVDGEGERLDRFELVAELASGGMATVYLARLSGVAGFQRLVAIKRLHPHLAKEPDFIEMFLDEARLAARIHHPNVVPIQEVGESPQGYYLVMDYVDGDTLARLLARAAQAKTQIPWGVTIRILLDTLAGLHAAHELKDDLGQALQIVHRDVSPQNILVGADGIARITDFGVARASSRLSTTRSGQLKGKLAYMAPEQARGENIDRRADIFSCGIVLWECLALKRLFKGEGEAQTLNRVLYDPIAPPTSVRADIPRELEAICMKALERDVDKRFTSSQEFAEELERVGRALSCVGSVRDVAACLESVFGADLVQQREAVRAWLARSEPSGSSPRSRRPSLPESVATRVDSRTKTEPSNPSNPSRPGPPVDRLAVTAPAPPGTASAPPPPISSAPSPSPSHPPENLSSLSSAVLYVPSQDRLGTTFVPPQRRSPLRYVALMLVSGITIGVGVYAATQINRGGSSSKGTTAAGPPATPTTVAAAPTEPSATASASSSATVASASAEPSASASVAAKKTTPPFVLGKKPGGITTAAQVPTTRPTTPPTTTNVPDDLSKNPYR